VQEWTDSRFWRVSRRTDCFVRDAPGRSGAEELLELRRGEGALAGVRKKLLSHSRHRRSEGAQRNGGAGLHLATSEGVEKGDTLLELLEELQGLALFLALAGPASLLLPHDIVASFLAAPVSAGACRAEGARGRGSS
jgi:hypothetical protein